jgi:hypothetical protein
MLGVIDQLCSKGLLLMPGGPKPYVALVVGSAHLPGGLEWDLGAAGLNLCQGKFSIQLVEPACMLPSCMDPVSPMFRTAICRQSSVFLCQPGKHLGKF